MWYDPNTDRVRRGKKSWHTCPGALRDVLCAIETLQPAANCTGAQAVCVLWVSGTVRLCIDAQALAVLCQDHILQQLWDFCLRQAKQCAAIYNYCEPTLPRQVVDRLWWREQMEASRSEFTSVLCGVGASPYLQTHLHFMSDDITVFCLPEQSWLWRFHGFSDVRRHEGLQTLSAGLCVTRDTVILDDADWLICQSNLPVVQLPHNVHKVWMTCLSTDTPSFHWWPRFAAWAQLPQSVNFKEWMKRSWRHTRPRQVHNTACSPQHVLLTPNFDYGLTQWVTLKHPLLPQSFTQHLGMPHPDHTEVCPICVHNTVDVMLGACSHSCCLDCFRRCIKQNARCMFCRAPIESPIFYNMVTAWAKPCLARDTTVFVANASNMLPRCFVEWITRLRGPGMVVTNIWEARAVLRARPDIDTWAIAGADIPTWLADLLQDDFVGGD